MAFRNILAAVDVSAGPSRALARALIIANEQGATLQVMDVGGHGPHRGPADASFKVQVATAIAALQPGRKPGGVHIEVIAEPARSAAHLAHAAGAQALIVMDRASSRRSALRGGSLSERLLRLCDGPVLITRSPVQGAYRRVLVAIDLTPVAQRLVSLAGRISPHGAVEMLHVIRPLHANPLRDAEVPERILTAYVRRRRSEAYAHLLRLTEATQVCPTRVAPIVREGDPAHHTALHQSHANADLVVIGKRRRSAAGDLFLGGTAQRVLAWCGGDILVSPYDGADTQAASTRAAATHLRPS